MNPINPTNNIYTQTTVQSVPMLHLSGESSVPTQSSEIVPSHPSTDPSQPNFLEMCDELANIIEEHATWQDPLSKALRTEGNDLLDIAYSYDISNDAVQRKAKEKLESIFYKTLIDPMTGQIFKDPIIERTFVWEKELRQDYMKYYCQFSLNTSTIPSPFDDQTMTSEASSHTFAKKIILWADPIYRLSEIPLMNPFNGIFIPPKHSFLYLQNIAKTEGSRRKEQEKQKVAKQEGERYKQLFLEQQEIVRRQEEQLKQLRIDMEKMIQKRINEINEISNQRIAVIELKIKQLEGEIELLKKQLQYSEENCLKLQQQSAKQQLDIMRCQQEIAELHQRLNNSKNDCAIL